MNREEKMIITGNESQHGQNEAIDNCIEMLIDMVVLFEATGVEKSHQLTALVNVLCRFCLINSLNKLHFMKMCGDAFDFNAVERNKSEEEKEPKRKTIKKILYLTANQQRLKKANI